MYVEDLKRGTNKDIGPKDIFEMGSNQPFQNLWLTLSNMINPVIVFIVILWFFIKNNDLYYHSKSPTTRRASGLDFSAIGGKKQWIGPKNKWK